MVTFGNITTKLLGNFPLVSFTNVVRKISKVRNPLSFISSVKGFIRIPINGESVFSFIPLATSFAAFSAVASSSSLLLFPKPSSKSILKSSIASVFKFCNYFRINFFLKVVHHLLNQKLLQILLHLEHKFLKLLMLFHLMILQHHT